MYYNKYSDLAFSLEKGFLFYYNRIETEGYNLMSQVDGNKKTILTGNVLSTLMNISYPIIIAMTCQTAFNFIDTYFVSRLGSDAIAAMSLTFPFFIFLIALAIGLSIGTSSLVARTIGAGKIEETQKGAKNAILLALITGLVFTGGGIFLAPYLVSFMGATGQIYDYTLQYVVVILSASLLKYGFNVLDGTIRGEGNTKVSMVMMITAILTNIILDPFLIFGIGFFPRLEMAGAALATGISWGVGCLVVIIYYLLGKGIIRLNLNSFKLDLNSMLEIIKVGLPSALSHASMAITILFLSRIILNMETGENIIAAYGLGFRVEMVALLPVVGLRVGTIIMVGQNYGAGLFNRVKAINQQGNLFIFLIMVLVGLIYALVAPYVMGLFTREANIFNLGIQYMRYVALSYGFIGMGMVSNASFQGMGRGFPPLVNTFLRLIIFQLSLSYLFGVVLKKGAPGIWVGIFLSNIMYGLLSFLWVNYVLKIKKEEGFNKEGLLKGKV